MSARIISHEEAPSSKDFGNFDKVFDQSPVDLKAQEKDYIPPQPKIGSAKSLTDAMSPLVLVSAPEILQKGFQLESRKDTKHKSAIPFILKEKEDVPTENLLSAQNEGFSIRKHIRAATYSLWNRKNN